MVLHRLVQSYERFYETCCEEKTQKLTFALWKFRKFCDFLTNNLPKIFSAAVSVFFSKIKTIPPIGADIIFIKKEKRRRMSQDERKWHSFRRFDDRPQTALSSPETFKKLWKFYFWSFFFRKVVVFWQNYPQSYSLLSGVHLITIITVLVVLDSNILWNSAISFEFYFPFFNVNAKFHFFYYSKFLAPNASHPWFLSFYIVFQRKSIFSLLLDGACLWWLTETWARRLPPLILFSIPKNSS